MPIPLNEDIAGLLDEVARLFAEQGANRFRVQAYHRAAEALRGLARPVSEVFAEQGLAGLEELPGIGESIARSIRDVLLHGRLAMLDRLRGQHDPIALLCSVSGIGKAFAWKLHEDLEIETLEELEDAAHDGRLENLAGFGVKRLAGIRDSLAHRLARVRQPAILTADSGALPSVAELLDVDSEYRREAAASTLKKFPRAVSTRRARPGCRCCIPRVANDITPPSSPTRPAPIECRKPGTGWCFSMTATKANSDARSSLPSLAGSRAGASCAGGRSSARNTIAIRASCRGFSRASKRRTNRRSQGRQNFANNWLQAEAAVRN